MTRALLIVTAARIAHEANRALCQSLGDPSQVPWDEAPAWQRESAIAGVEAIADGTVMRAEQSHESWLEQKKAEGWEYGETKDPEAKTHPCFLPFAELPPELQMKDHLFVATVKTVLMNAVWED